MKYFKIAISLCLILFVLCACGKSDAEPTTEATEPVITTESTTEPETTTQVAKTEASTKAEVTTTAAPVTETTTRGAKYGDSELTTDTNNRYVEAVVNKYGIDTEGLVTIYSKVGGNNNYVLQFDGTRNSEGKLVRTGDTLKYVYPVSEDFSTVSRMGGYSGNDNCTLKESLTVFLLTKQVILPQFEDQLNS